jgi:hypothetical protein
MPTKQHVDGGLRANAQQGREQEQPMRNATSKQRDSPGRSVIARIVSGGQTGADRGGLDAAIRLGLAHGGWCPKGRRAEDGTIPAQYRLTETKSRTYSERTRRNVIDSDATVVFTKGLPTAGSRLTIEMTDEEDRPMLHIDISGWPGDRGEDVETFRGWLAARHVSTLNVAGSRESKTPGLQRLVEQFLVEALAPAADEASPLAAEPAGAWDSAATGDARTDS